MTFFFFCFSISRGGGGARPPLDTRLHMVFISCSDHIVFISFLSPVHMVFISFLSPVHMVFISCSYSVHMVFISRSYRVDIVFLSCSYRVHIVFIIESAGELMVETGNYYIEHHSNNRKHQYCFIEKNRKR